MRSVPISWKSSLTMRTCCGASSAVAAQLRLWRSSRSRMARHTVGQLRFSGRVSADSRLALLSDDGASSVPLIHNVFSRTCNPRVFVVDCEYGALWLRYALVTRSLNGEVIGKHCETWFAAIEAASVSLSHRVNREACALLESEWLRLVSECRRAEVACQFSLAAAQHVPQAIDRVKKLQAIPALTVC